MEPEKSRLEQEASWIFHELTARAIKAHDAVFAANYAKAKRRVVDEDIGKMLTNILLYKARKLRDDGKIPSEEELRQKAQTMASMDTEELEAAFAAFSAEMQAYATR